MLGSDSGFIHVADRIIRGPIKTSHLEMESAEIESAQPRILVVDDEKLIADTTAEILNGSGFHAKGAYDGQVALEIATEFQPDYLLTDVLMPRMNGVELAIAVHKMSPATRILLFSGQAGISEILLEGKARGYEFELIPKPIHPAKLVDRFKKH